MSPEEARPEHTTGRAFCFLDADQMDSLCQVHARSMERIDWTYALSVAATLALAAGAICILLFAL
jgi:hypothetical protein